MNKVEPRAEIRVAAHELRELYVALLAEGFTEGEALTVLGHIVVSRKP
jgi:hypothetical protein